MKKRIPPSASFNINLVLLVVFGSGYLVMALEILSFRIIQPFFGNSIYATGAVLGIVLTALTIGYWLGGALSVRLAPTRIQSTALLLGGLWIFSMGGIPSKAGRLLESTHDPRETGGYVLEPPARTAPNWVMGLPIGDSMEVRMRIDPLIASTILFFIPSMLLAMTGPCAVRMLTQNVADAGKTSGWVFALGSLGSIAGVLFTSFWLIAVLGVLANLRLVGLGALLTGALAALSGRQRRN
jgi:hypothetical protein